MNGPRELERVTNQFQAVLVHIDQIDMDKSTPIEEELIALLEPTNFAYHDGNEIGGGRTTLWMFGTDAEQLFTFVEPTLRRFEFCTSARIVLRFGEPGAPEREFRL